MSSADDFLNIDTPENVIFGYEVVSIGSRFMAALIDTFLIVILQIMAVLTLQLILSATTAFGGLESAFIAVYVLISFVLLWGYYIFFEMLWNGRTPGKKVVNLRVIRRDGTPITLTESIVRNLVRLVDFLPFAYGLGIVVMFIDGKSRRLGDMAAGTLVVREQESVTLESLEKSTRVTVSSSSLWEPSQSADAIAGWPIERLTDADIQLAVDLLNRRNQLANADALASQILWRLMEKMDASSESVPRSENMEVLNFVVKRYRNVKGQE